DLATVGLCDVANDRKSEARTTGVATSRAVDAIEALEDALEVAARNSDAVIAHGDRYPIVIDERRTDLDWCTGHRILDRVVQQVDDRASHLTHVAHDLHVGWCRVDPERYFGRVGGGLHEIDTLRNEVSQGQRFPQRRLLRFDRAEVEKIVDDARQPIRFTHNP